MRSLALVVVTIISASATIRAPSASDVAVKVAATPLHCCAEERAARGGNRTRL